MLKSNLQTRIIRIRDLALRPSEPDGIPPCWSESRSTHNKQLPTHERSTVFEILFVVRDTIAGEVVTREIESVGGPKVVLRYQLAHRQ